MITESDVYHKFSNFGIYGPVSFGHTFVRFHNEIVAPREIDVCRGPECPRPGMSAKKLSCFDYV